MARQSRRTRKNRATRKIRKQVPWAGWSKKAPQGHQRTVMLRKCGKKCFLGPRKSFPICTKGTCKVNTKGVYAAYVRSRQWGKAPSHYKGLSRPSMKRSVYTNVSRKAKAMLERRGYRVGKSAKKSKGRRGGRGNKRTMKK